MKADYSIENLLLQTNKAVSMRELIINLGLAAKGSNYKTVIAKLKYYSINTDHFTGAGWRKGKKFATKKSKLEEVLVKNSTYSSGVPYASSKIKDFLFKNDLKNRQCENCDLLVWLGNDMIFELHHMDGD